MADLSIPLEWHLPASTPLPPVAAAAPAAAASQPAAAAALAGKTVREAFRWPTPPFPSYPSPTEQNEPLPCLIIGRNDKRMNGRMTFFVPEQGVAHMQFPPARTTLGLRFDQFRSLTLTTPLAPLVPRSADPHAEMLSHRASTPFRIEYAKGGETSGATVGHVENEFGLFLFPPCGDDGSGSRSARASATCWSSNTARRRSRSARRSACSRTCATRSSATCW